MGKLVGAPETHSCANGHTFTCAGGTRGCADDSPLHCGAQQPGRLETHSCADGHTFSCHGGTRGCADDSPLHCAPVCEPGTLAICVGDGYVPLDGMYF